MAWVNSVELKVGGGSVHAAQLAAVISVFHARSDALVVQLDVDSASENEGPDAQLQSLQFGVAAAHQLYRILKDTYKFQD
jgi:hypothetical protein